jgi:hypothetical protein
MERIQLRSNNKINHIQQPKPPESIRKLQVKKEMQAYLAWARTETLQTTLNSLQPLPELNFHHGRLEIQNLSHRTLIGSWQGLET